MRIRNGALRYSIAWAGSAALGCMDAEDAAATECLTGASADLIGACSKRNGLARNAFSQQARECLRRLSHSRPPTTIPDEVIVTRVVAATCENAIGARSCGDVPSRRCSTQVGVRFRGPSGQHLLILGLPLLIHSVTSMGKFVAIHRATLILGPRVCCRSDTLQQKIPVRVP